MTTLPTRVACLRTMPMSGPSLLPGTQMSASLMASVIIKGVAQTSMSLRLMVRAMVHTAMVMEMSS